MRRLCVLLFVLSTFSSAGVSFAQGRQTGTITGTVKDQQDLPVPGVLVTATSPALQGSRTALTDNRGTFSINFLPAGDYQVRYELNGFTTVSQQAAVPLGLTIDESVTLQAGAVTDVVQVTASTPAPIETPIVGANFKHDEIEQLATPRTVEGIAQLAPSVNENSPNVGQMVINGAFAFDNVFMVNGVDVNDNLFATPQNLFIEDAIQETQILTSGISAEYGRFTGGVINAITKSGGNMFSGSARVNFSNPSWTTASPYETTKGIAGTAHPDTLSKSYEGTFGGPILKDRLWFFGSARYASIDNTAVLPQSGVVVPTNDLNKRGEGKLTATLGKSQTLQAGYLTDPRTLTNNSGLQSYVIDPHSEVTRSEPNWYYYTNYHGTIGRSTLVEGQYSQRHFQFLGDGGTGTDLIQNSPILSLSCACVYNAPYFDATDPENRNNRQVTGSVTNSWGLKGAHVTKAGYEFYRSQRIGGNSQSPTSYVFNADFLTDNSGAAVLDGTGRPIPVFVPGASYDSYYPAVRGATMNTDNQSVYLQDHWTIGSRLTADIGARYEHVKASSTGGIVSVDNNRVVPRLAAAYDLTGNGNHVFHVTYGQYSGRYDEAQIGANSPVGNPPEVDSVYQGPAGQGYGFAPGFALSNYPINAANSAVSDPTQNIKVNPNLKSPLVHEFTASYGANLWNGRGYGEVSFVARVTHDLIEDFQDLTTGTTDVIVNGVSAGVFTNKVYENATPDQAHRTYQSLVFQSRYRITHNWNINGHYTLELKNDGNYEGEATNQPGFLSFIGNYPEAFTAARNFPDGNLQDFQRHRLRLWSIYNMDMGRFGDLSLSGLLRADSGVAYSLVARNQAITPQQTAILTAAGYTDGPSNSGNEVFFTGARGDQFFNGYAVVDTSINYNIPIFKTLKPWVKFDVYNLFNNEKLIAYSTTITQNTAGGVDSLGLATGFTKSASFGTATGNTVTNLYNGTINAFPLAFAGATPGGRTYRVSTGFRF